jgi:hypothetical protein
LWELPLVEGWQYQHAGLLLSGAKVRETAAGVANVIAALQEELTHERTGDQSETVTGQQPIQRGD